MDVSQILVDFMKNKQIIIIFFVIVAVFLSVFFYNKNKTKIYYPTSGENIIFLGDSLVEGIGSSKDNDMVSVLSKRLNIDIINAGVKGDTTAKALDRLQADVLDKNPKVVLILLGGNDALRKIPIENTRKNLENIILQIKKTGATVILIGVKGSLLGNVYDDMFSELASELQVNYIDNIYKGFFFDSRYKYDSIHPNDAGYLKMVDRIEPVLRQVLDL